MHAMQPGCSFVNSSRTVGVGLASSPGQFSAYVNITDGKKAMYTEYNEHMHRLGMQTGWVCKRSNMSSCKWLAQTKAAKLWRSCSWDFTRSTVYLVVQVGLSRWELVRCGKLTLHWTLDHWQQLSRCANHAIARQQERIHSKFCRIDIVAIQLHCSF